MAISDLYCLPATLKRHHQPPLGNFIDGFQEWLDVGQFTTSTMIQHITYITLFSEYLATQSVSHPSAIQQHHIDQFIQQYDDDKRRDRPWLYAINRLLKYFHHIGVNIACEQIEIESEKILAAYCDWAAQSCNLCPSTIALRQGCLARFFNKTKFNLTYGSLKTLNSETLQSQFLESIKSQGKAARRTTQSALRSFFKFCFFSGHTQHDLSLAIPVLHSYRLSSLPRIIETPDIKQLFQNIDRDSSTGKRDYAMILLLYYYGVRGVQIRRLKLSDIEWKKSRIHFAACKGGRLVIMPLINEVGDALVDYLQTARPLSEQPYVFLTSRAPYHPLTYSSTLSAILARYQHSAHIKLSRYGSHCYRHSFATRALQQGYSLKAIADCLGHKWLQTTQIYTKVDVCTLSQITLELPGGVQ